MDHNISVQAMKTQYSRLWAQSDDVDTPLMIIVLGHSDLLVISRPSTRH